MAGVAALNEEVEGSPITYHFNYQATASFDITINWEFTSTPTDPAFTITYQELGGSEVADSATTPGTTGDFTVTLPASVFCYVKIEASGSCGTLTTSLS
jgi:hypothetical protein